MDDHFSRTPVTRRLQRPTREVSGLPHASPIWPCSGWGLPGRPVTRPPVRSYRTVSSLPATGRRSDFCCTFPGVAPAGRYPAPCPVLFGLSSDGATADTARDRLTGSLPINAGYHETNPAVRLHGRVRLQNKRVLLADGPVTYAAAPGLTRLQPPPADIDLSAQHQGPPTHACLP